MGLVELKVEGKLDLKQFWPDGQSDADTTKLLVTPGPKGFQYRAAGSTTWTSTNVFDGATVGGASGSKAVLNNKGALTVRLQGVDAPELHYRAALLSLKTKSGKKKAPTAETKSLQKEHNKDYRQHYGESAVLALRRKLGARKGGAVACTVSTTVEVPNDTFDTYARLIGDVVVGKLNVNRWLLEHGWAVPSFYTSMSRTEITELTALALAARKKGRGFWRDYSAKVPTFDAKLQYRRPTKAIKPVPADDGGPVAMPKLFRRQTSWYVNQKVKRFVGGYDAYLAAQGDKAIATNDFLSQGRAAAAEQPLTNFVKKGTAIVKPEGIVIREKPSSLKTRPGRSATW